MLPAQTSAKVKDVNKAIKQCSEIIGRVNRLICYDDLAKEQGHIPPDKVNREKTVLETYGFWEVTKKRNAAGEDIIYLKNDAVEYVVSQLGIKRKPTFVIKCKHGKTEAYIDWKSKIMPRNYSGYTKMSVFYKIDSAAFRQVSWELSTDKQAIFVPNPVEFVKEMHKKDKIVFEITPPHDVAQTIVHDISGLSEVLKILVDKCY